MNLEEREHVQSIPIFFLLLQLGRNIPGKISKVNYGISQNAWVSRKFLKKGAYLRRRRERRWTEKFFAGWGILGLLHKNDQQILAVVKG